MSTPAQVSANQANAQFSTGPVTDAGKAASSQNAVKHALTGRTVLLPTDDPAAYAQHLAHHQTFLRAGTAEEHTLVHELADIRWRLDRIATLETGLYALGHREFAPLFEDEPGHIRLAMIQAHTYRAYAKDFRNLHTQESRLRGAEQKTSAKIQAVQADFFKQQEEAAAQPQPLPTAGSMPTDPLTKAAYSHQLCSDAKIPFDPAAFGFEFSIVDIEEFLTAPKLSKAA